MKFQDFSLENKPHSQKDNRENNGEIKKTTDNKTVGINKAEFLGTLNSYRIDNIKDNYHINDNNGDIKTSPLQPRIKEKGDKAVKQWLADMLRNKLRSASILSLQSHKPIILYRKDIEESENAVEEEISYITGKHVVQFMYSYGGFIPSSFQTIEVFTLDKFAKWIVQEQQKDLLLQCIDNLELK